MKDMSLGNVAQAVSTLFEKSGDETNKSCHIWTMFEPEHPLALVMEEEC